MCARRAAGAGAAHPRHGRGGGGTGRDRVAGAGGGGEPATRARHFPRTGEMRILAGRHPVIERLAEQEAGRFIPNDLYPEHPTRT